MRGRTGCALGFPVHNRFLPRTRRRCAKRLGKGAAGGRKPLPITKPRAARTRRGGQPRRPVGGGGRPHPPTPKCCARQWPCQIGGVIGGLTVRGTKLVTSRSGKD